MIRIFPGLCLSLLTLSTGCATPLKGRHVYSADVWSPSRVDLRYDRQGESGNTTLLKGTSLEAAFEHMRSLPPEDAILLVHFTKGAQMTKEDRIGEQVASAAIEALPPDWLERTRFIYDRSSALGPPWMRLDHRTGQYIEDTDFEW